MSFQKYYILRTHITTFIKLSIIFQIRDDEILHVHEIHTKYTYIHVDLTLDILYLKFEIYNLNGEVLF